MRDLPCDDLDMSRRESHENHATSGLSFLAPLAHQWTLTEVHPANCDMHEPE